MARSLFVVARLLLVFAAFLGGSPTSAQLLREPQAPVNKTPPIAPRRISAHNPLRRNAAATDPTSSRVVEFLSTANTGAGGALPPPGSNLINVLPEGDFMQAPPGTYWPDDNIFGSQRFGPNHRSDSWPGPHRFQARNAIVPDDPSIRPRFRLLGRWPWCGGCGPLFDGRVFHHLTFNAFQEKPARYTGEGNPLIESTWMSRPYHADLFSGAIVGSPLISGRVDQGSAVFYGIRLGKDLGPYWGWETRLAAASIPVYDNQNPAVPRNNDVVLWDAMFTYYPWGDARWRPYLFAGLGVVNVNYADENGVVFDESLIGMPLGIGLKYLWQDWIVVRAQLTDNIAFGGGGGGSTDAMNNFSYTLGIELRYGGPRHSYWPWNPGRYMW